MRGHVTGRSPELPRTSAVLVVSSEPDFGAVVLLSYANEARPRATATGEDAGAKPTVSAAMRDPEEGRLISLAAGGDTEAFTRLVQNHSTLVYRIAFRMLGGDSAQDASQEVWIRAWQNIRKFKGESAFSTWVSRITINTCLTSREREARRREVTSEVPFLLDEFGRVGGDGDPETQALDRERQDEIKEALTQVRAEHRAAVVLRHLEGMSYPEIAEILDVPLGTAKGWAARGRAALLVALSRGTDGEGRGT